MKTINKSLAEKVLKEGKVIGKKYRYELRSCTNGEKYVSAIDLRVYEIAKNDSWNWKTVYYF